MRFDRCEGVKLGPKGSVEMRMQTVQGFNGSFVSLKENHQPSNFNASVNHPINCPTNLIKVSHQSGGQASRQASNDLTRQLAKQI